MRSRIASSCAESSRSSFSVEIRRNAIVPSRRDLRLGKRLAVRFVQASLPERLEETYEIFAARGAYARFKDMLERDRALEAWYAFEAEAVERELRDWAESEALAVAASPLAR